MPGSRDNIPAHECTQEHRIQKLESKAEAQEPRIQKLEAKAEAQEQINKKSEAKADAHESRLSAGDVGFAEVRKDLAQIQTTLTKIEVSLTAPKPEPSRLDKFWDACINWSAAVIMVSLLWAIAKSGQIPGVHP